VALNSGTSALHLALTLADVRSGDEVILPAQTFVASGLTILQQGAIPVFADIDYASGEISIESIKKKISKKTKAIMPVHWGGYPCDLEKIGELAKQYNLSVIEDAAHALGATYKNIPIGAISHFTCFSFQAIKHVTTGDGGALCVNTMSAYERAISKRWFGINRAKAPVNELGERSYNIVELGYKYHMNNYAAALGKANLQSYPNRLQKRLSVAAYYIKQLGGVGGISLFKYAPDRQSAYWLFGFHVENRSGFVKALKDRNVMASVVHQRIDRNNIFGALSTDLEEQTRFDKTQINIPIHDGIDLEKAEYIVSAIKQGW
jgi:perosamine synthetase